MLIAKILALAGALLMGASIGYAVIYGDFGKDGAQMLALPWGIVSLVDLYTGFTLFSLWIVYRERSLAKAAIWIFLMMTLGFFTGSVYTLIALHTSRGDWKRFWMGSRATS
ncbi:MAG: DUF1475 family protein [Acidobacteriota bacterium]|nr:DUF1475 domain-containing protein [Blastocatellia bacterium]MDW8411231.1 DUF1475 family protein [Acidobacteriota bacterium]